ncbi:MAG: SMP-30/gluconolactonase/LRE family protein [Chitinophagaceae bacterium]
MKKNPSLTIYDDCILEFINPGFQMEKWVDDCQFTEGPVWNKNGFYLFSDIPKNIIYQFYPGASKQIFLNHSGANREDSSLSEQIGSNGLAYDDKENLFICQHGNGAVIQYTDGVIKPLITEYQGKRFNSPNDIVVHPNDKIFFSDPPYGLKDQQLQPENAQPLAGIYCWNKGETKLICDLYKYPNGVCLSPDLKSLFICSNKPFENFITEYDTKTLALNRKFAYENSDGIKCDPFHNLWLCAKEGIIIIDSQGKRLGKISLQTIPANCCWGGIGLTDLFITARENIFCIKNLLVK